MRKEKYQAFWFASVWVIGLIGTTVVVAQDVPDPSIYYSCASRGCDVSDLRRPYNCLGPTPSVTFEGASVISACTAMFEQTCVVQPGESQSQFRMTAGVNDAWAGNALEFNSIDTVTSSDNADGLGSRSDYDVDATCEFQPVSSFGFDTNRTVRARGYIKNCSDPNHSWQEAVGEDDADGCKPFEGEMKNAGCPTNFDVPRANPCFPGRGNKYQREVDYASAGSDIEIVRHYNSWRSPFNYGLGHGWGNTLVSKRLFPTYFDEGHARIFMRMPEGNSIQLILTNPRFPEQAEWVLDDDFIYEMNLETNLDITVTHRNGNVDRYNRDGLLLTETTPSGNVTTYTYNGDDELIRVVFPYGHEITLTWADDHVATITDPHNGTYSYTYDDNYNLERVTFPDGTYRQYSYGLGNLINKLTGIEDERGVLYAEFDYDPNSGNATDSMHAPSEPGMPNQEHFQFSYQ